MLSPRDGAELARFARACVREELGGAPAAWPTETWCREPGASFVTLRWREQVGGRLQGCIGSLVARRPLAHDVAHNALAAAFRDPRGARLSLPALDELHVEVSVLSPLETIDFDGSEDGALAALRPGVDGVVLSWGGRRGTFLPVMWEQLPTPRIFLDELKQKARLPASFWAPGVELQRYTAQKLVDPSPRALASENASA